MPYKLIKKESGKYEVKGPGGVHAKNTTKKKALAQERLLHYIDYLKSKGKKLPKQK